MSELEIAHSVQAVGLTANDTFELGIVLCIVNDTLQLIEALLMDDGA